jgi:hypothetical protein
LSACNERAYTLQEMAKMALRTSKRGNKINIVLDVKEYEKLLDDLDELDSIRAYDAAKNSGETPIPFEQAMQQSERSRK